MPSVASIFFSMEILEFYTNIPWVMMVSNYVFLVGSSVGLTLVVCLGLVFGLRRYEMIAKRGLFVALIAIICGLTSIGLHLGHPERGAIYNVLPAQLSFRYVVDGSALSSLYTVRSGGILASGQGGTGQKGKGVGRVKGEALWVDGDGGFEGVSLSTFPLAEMGIGNLSAPASREIRPVAQF